MPSVVAASVFAWTSFLGAWWVDAIASPQKRQVVSAFALTYSLRLRSCKVMDAFVISSLPSRLKRRYRQQGPIAPRTLLRFFATPDPSATLPPSIDFPD